MATRKADAINRQLNMAAELCLRQNAQLTELRRSVLGLILDAERPLTAYQLLDRLRPTRRSVAPPTVYRTLDFLIANGLVHKVERLNAFVSCTEMDHSHAHGAQFLICTDCGQVEEMEERTVSRTLQAAARRHGFTPAVAMVEVEGTCSACAGAA